MPQKTDKRETELPPLRLHSKIDAYIQVPREGAPSLQLIDRVGWMVQIYPTLFYTSTQQSSEGRPVINLS